MEYEIVHSGIKGMKWGIRRYQNKDGTLTAAGKKRYAKQLAKVKEEERILKNKQATKAKFDKLEARQKAVEEGKKALAGGDKKPAKPKTEAKPDAPQKKTIKDMSDDELASAVRRAQLEKQYRDLHPKQVSAGEKFLKGTLLPVIGEVSKNVARDALTKKGKEWLGLNTENESEKLKKKAEDAKNKWQLENYKSKLKDLESGGKASKDDKDD